MTVEQVLLSALNNKFKNEPNNSIPFEPLLKGLSQTITAVTQNDPDFEAIIASLALHLIEKGEFDDLGTLQEYLTVYVPGMQYFGRFNTVRAFLKFCLDSLLGTDIDQSMQQGKFQDDKERLEIFNRMLVLYKSSPMELTGICDSWRLKQPKSAFSINSLVSSASPAAPTVARAPTPVPSPTISLTLMEVDEGTVHEILLDKNEIKYDWEKFGLDQKVIEVIEQEAQREISLSSAALLNILSQAFNNLRNIKIREIINTTLAKLVGEQGSYASEFFGILSFMQNLLTQIENEKVIAKIRKVLTVVAQKSSPGELLVNFIWFTAGLIYYTDMDPLEQDNDNFEFIMQTIREYLIENEKLYAMLTFQKQSTIETGKKTEIQQQITTVAELGLEPTIATAVRKAVNSFIIMGQFEKLKVALQHSISDDITRNKWLTGLIFIRMINDEKTPGSEFFEQTFALIIKEIMDVSKESIHAEMLTAFMNGIILEAAKESGDSSPLLVNLLWFDLAVQSCPEIKSSDPLVAFRAIQKVLLPHTSLHALTEKLYQSPSCKISAVAEVPERLTSQKTPGNF